MSPLEWFTALALLVGDARGNLFAPTDVEFPFDDDTRLLDGQTLGGKLWRSPGVPSDGEAVPLVVFFHGIVGDNLRHHWLSRDPAGPWDVRPTVAKLTLEGSVAPVLVAAPSQTRDSLDPSKIFEDLDLSGFVDAVDGAAWPHQRVDRQHIVVVAHSASACGPGSPMVTSLRASNRPYAVIGVDGCLGGDDARALQLARGVEWVIVTYQNAVWPRPFEEFEQVWQSFKLPGAASAAAVRPALMAATPELPAVHRKLDRIPVVGEDAHLEIVGRALERWLPKVLPRSAPPVSSPKSASPVAP